MVNEDEVCLPGSGPFLIALALKMAVVSPVPLDICTAWANGF